MQLKTPLSQAARRRFRSFCAPHVQRYETHSNDSKWTSYRLIHKLPRKNFTCDDCRGKYYQYNRTQFEGAPMLRIDLWKRIAGDSAVWLCLDCARKRLGRPFTEYDFKHPWWDYQLLPSYADERMNEGRYMVFADS